MNQTGPKFSLASVSCHFAYMYLLLDVSGFLHSCKCHFGVFMLFLFVLYNKPDAFSKEIWNSQDNQMILNSDVVLLEAFGIAFG